MRTPFLLLAALFALAAPTFAGLEIKKARYGNTTAFNDVRGILEAYIRNNTLSFPVGARSLGGDPTVRAVDFLFVVYEVNGREYTDTVPEGKVFTFQGIPGLRPVQPPLNLPFLKPSAPTSAPLALVNRSGSPATAYTVDRYGRWVWAAELPHGQTVTLRSKVGEQWILADARGTVLARERISSGDNVLIAEPAGTGRGGYRPGGEEAWLRFENTSYRPIYIYNLDQAGRWNWMATLEPGGGYSASTRVGETWIAADTGNRVLRTVTAAPGQARVKLN